MFCVGLFATAVQRLSSLCSNCGPGALARKSQLCSTAVVKETCPRGPPNGAGFEYGQENIYFRIGLVLAILKVVFPDLGLPKQLFIIRETFINRGNGLRGMFERH